jgi:hypothetical protein
MPGPLRLCRGTETHGRAAPAEYGPGNRSPAAGRGSFQQARRQRPTWISVCGHGADITRAAKSGLAGFQSSI